MLLLLMSSVAANSNWNDPSCSGKRDGDSCEIKVTREVTQEVTRLDRFMDPRLHQVTREVTQEVTRLDRFMDPRLHPRLDRFMDPRLHPVMDSILAQARPMTLRALSRSIHRKNDRWKVPNRPKITINIVFPLVNPRLHPVMDPRLHPVMDPRLDRFMDPRLHPVMDPRLDPILAQARPMTLRALSKIHPQEK